jgi:hypothetical protein
VSGLKVSENGGGKYCGIMNVARIDKLIAYGSKPMKTSSMRSVVFS